MSHQRKHSHRAALRDAEASPDAAPMCEFTADMSVGIVTLDADHMAIFEIAKLLLDTPHNPEHALVLSSVIAVLEEAVDGHFLREERAMRKAGYPRLADHRRKHAKFRAHLKSIVEAYLQGTTSAVDGLPSFVSRWFSDHIRTKDSKYKDWVTSSAVDDRPLAFLSMEAEDSRQ